MHYVYMDNFRGFRETLIPLRKTNFLVGENSTGKSSFLSLLYLVSRPPFWFYPEFSIQEELELGGFSDIVSAWAEDKSSFKVGVVFTRKDKSGRTELAFSIHTFAEKDGTPQLVENTQLRANKLTALVFESKRTKYRTLKSNTLFESEDEAIAEFVRLSHTEIGSTQGLKAFPRGIPSEPPLPVALSILQSLESGEKVVKNEFKAEIPIALDMTWVAPIRTKPRRIYDGMKRSYSPEGEHIPLLLRKSLRSTSKSEKFADSLAAFGNASGLFETVVAHSFGRGNQTPFELLIKFKGAELNINNVGYGVSQALPLVVEFLTSEKNGTFAVQQPEVHLHPKAQAALGGLIFQLAAERKHAFFIETHSDYLIDRYRLSMRNEPKPPDSQVVFFVRTPKGNEAHILPISADGLYPSEQPNEFRDFFIKEEMSLLDI
ncbi:MAG TPA: AAA family ATPase [Rhodocyclaceae bacterium]|nr:AAA family ATPase [Rhodocyclaceae bacterium]